MKKPKNVGFFDYSMPALRRHFCEQEVRLNTRLAPHVYLGVASVLLFADHRIRFGPIFSPGDVPMPGTIHDGGYVLELEATGRYDLTRSFVESYIAETGDDALRELLPFYTCYRACVRGKVASFQLDELEVPAAQRGAARVRAASLFGLAGSYASGPTKATLVMVGGLMGTGKSTLA